MNYWNETINRQMATAKLFFAILFTMVLLLAGQTTCHATTVVLQWDAETDPAVAGYKVYYKADSSVQPFTGSGATQGASPINVNKLTTATVGGLDPAHAYYFAVTAYNASGVESAYSNLVSVPEMVSPTISLGSPTNNTTVSGTVSVTASASDNVGVTKVEFYVNGVLKSSDTATPYVYSWNTSSLASGTYTLMAKAYDAAGNAGQSTNVAVTVVNDTTVPVVSLTAPVNNATVSGTVAITASASDNVGVSNVQFYENGVLLFASNVAPYTFNWNTTSVANGSYTLTSKAYDNAGNIGQSANVSVTVLNDTTAPTITAFTIPATAGSTTVPISSFTATDAVGVTGYLITTSTTSPAASAFGWMASAPTSVSANEGSNTFYAWAKDAVGNISSSRSATVTITLPDTTAPVVSAFTMPATASSTTVAISSFTANDAVGVTGYLITESASAPTASASGWTASTPASFTFSAAGSRTAYAWAKDAAGNVSSSRSAIVTITLPDTTAPAVSAFTMPATASSTTVPISTFTATDAVGVTGYLITTSATSPAASAFGWMSPAPTSVTANAGSNTFYAWAKDAAGNVSSSRSATVTITLPDTTAPAVAITAPANSATVSGTASVTVSATDNVGVIKVEFYMNGALQSTDSASPYTFSWNTASLASGNYTLTAKAYDAAGNVGQSANITVTVNNTVTPPSGSITAVFGNVTGSNYANTIEDTFLNLNNVVNATSKVLNTYTWPAKKPANAILMKWALTALPANAQIQSATLYLYQTSSGGDAQYEIPVSEVINKSPVISKSSGTTYDGVNSWSPSSVTNGGIPLAQSDIAPAVDAPLIDKTNGYKSWNVTNIVKDWVATPGNNKGLILDSSSKATADSYRGFASSEATNASQRPKLVVTYILN